MLKNVATTSEPQGVTPEPQNTISTQMRTRFKKWYSEFRRDFSQFLVLMWKHMTVRRRKFIATPIELISPCIFFMLLLLAKSLFIAVSRELINSAGYNSSSLRMPLAGLEMDKILAPQLILYTPDTVLTSRLMDEVGESLRMQRLLDFPVPSSRGYYALPADSLTYINVLIQHVSDDNMAVVVFENLEEEYWPMNLKYTIKMKKTFDNDDLDYEGVMTSEHGSNYERYMRLQWAIDSAYLTLRFSDQDTEVLPERRVQDRADYNNSTTPRLPRVTLFSRSKPDPVKQLVIFLICLLLRTLCPWSLLLPFVFLMVKLIDERSSGIQELVKQVGVSYKAWAHSHGCNMILTGLFYSISGTILCKVPENPYLEQTNGFLLFLMFELHFHSIMELAFICCCLTKSGNYGTTLAIILFILMYVPSALLGGEEYSKTSRYLSGILPHIPLSWFIFEVQRLEIKGNGLNFGNFFRIQFAFMSFFMMILQIIIFYYVAQYLHTILPGKYGTGKPWNYLCKRKEVVAKTAMEELNEERTTKRDPRFFEESQLTNVAIRIAGVSKIFGHQIALSNVSFDVYQGDITVLLGHNGAGKTTLMSIVTGMLSPTSGKIYVNGLDISEHKVLVQRMVGMCPQHNLFFSDFSVMEHIRLFAMLKGESYRKAKESSKMLLQKLGMADKHNFQTKQISGGMKRRLQMACALAGGSKILILDEPTAGLDVETRRELWNLLLSLRDQHTVVISTHFMEEADALGNRVAALHTGRLQCYATPMFLKKNIGMGYRLTLGTEGAPQQEIITELVQSVVPNATIKDSTYNTISYNLPSQSSDKFPNLFSKLEAEKSNLSILTIGVGVSSLEEVFMELCSDVGTTFTEDIDIGVPETQKPKIKGFPLYFRQMRVLLRRQIRFIMYNKYSFLTLQVLCPLVVLVFLLYGLRNDTENEGKSDLDMDDIIKGKDNTAILLRMKSSAPYRRTFERLTNDYKNVVFQFTNAAIQNAKNYTPLGSNSSKSIKYSTEIDLNDTDVKVIYTNMVRHGASIALNVLSNILAAQYFPSETGRAISVNSQPLTEIIALQSVNATTFKAGKNFVNCIFWIFMLATVILSTMINSVALPITEQETGTRNIYLMAGCPPAVYWITTLLTHIIFYTVVLLLPANLLFLIDQEDTLNNLELIGAMFLILILGSISFLCLCYLVAFELSRRGAGLLLSFCIFVGGTIPATFLFGVISYRTDTNYYVKLPIHILNYLFSPCTMTMAGLKAVYVARLNAFCNRNLNLCPVQLVNIFKIHRDVGPGLYELDGGLCCLKKKGPHKYLSSESYAPGKEILLMFVQFIVYGTLVILVQHGIFSGIYNRIFSAWYKPQPNRFHDERVEAEKTYIAEQMEKPPNQLMQGQNAMLVNGIHKNFFKFCKKNCNAVKGVSFSLKKGECFGLLGVNGAGKSTTFKMLTAEEVTTRGNIYANGRILKWPRSSKYLQSLAYCPQFYGVDEFMSGRENIATILTLRGLHSDDITKETKVWVQVVGLERYLDVLVAGYSGGCMRRLGTAAALSSGASITMLDEPTAGVDVSARRRVWVAMRKGLRQKRSIIVTSHSLDEIEALCDRIAIMSAGEVGALGSAAALRAAYATGYALAVKLRTSGITSERLDELKQKMNRMFNCSLDDEHQTMLHYHINEEIKYSELFIKLESLKEDFSDIIEDYSVTETTLEEVFLSFARQQTQ